MPEQLFANVASTTITSVITAVQTTLPVASSASFPSAVSTQDKEFQAAFVDDGTSPPTIREYVTVRNVNSSTSWTVVRQSQDSTRFPAGAWASGTRIVHLATASGFRDLAPRSRLPFNDIRDYGGVGTNSVASAGAVDNSQPFRDASTAANLSIEETYKTDANGTGTVYVPGNRDYAMLTTVNWPINVKILGGSGSGTGTGNPPRIRWKGAVGGTMFTGWTTGNNIPGISCENVQFDGRSFDQAGDAGYGLGAATAWEFGPDPSTPTANAKPDTGCQMVDTWFQKFHGDALRFLGAGLTNWVLERGRFDSIGGYAIYVDLSRGSAFLTIHDMTWDCGGVDDRSKGFLFFDGEATSINSHSFVGLSNLHLEINSSLTQTYIPTGWTPTGADTRGIVRLGVSTTAPQTVQHMMHHDNVWVPVASGKAPLSFYQVTSSNLAADNRTRHAQAIKIEGGQIHGIAGLAASTEDANGTTKYIAGVSAADSYPYKAGSTLGSRHPMLTAYAPYSSVPQGEQSVVWFKARTLIDGLNLPQSATVGAAGGGAALPATPVKYLVVYDDQGNQFKVAAYNP